MDPPKGPQDERNNPATLPLTITDWRTLQTVASDPWLLLALVERARKDTTNAWISIATPEQIYSQWEEICQLRSNGDILPLFGVPFAVKDNIDAAGFPTTAACAAFASGSADADASVIARLKAAGAVVVGKTNLDQFATGLVGTRSSYGAVKNPFDSRRVSGGSSSGSAVAVSVGLVPFALGSDTAGSGRVPAGFNNIIGLKPTRGALSTFGVLPACRTLDTVSILALTIDDAECVLQVAEGKDVKDAYSRPRPNGATSPSGSVAKSPSIAICAKPEWFGDATREKAYDNAVQRAYQLGWNLQPVDFSLLGELALMLYEGPWIAERYAAIASFIKTSPVEVFDPVVHKVITKAEGFNAVDVFQYEYRRQDLCHKIRMIFDGFDAILVPTSATFPTLSVLEKEPILENSRLGIYTNFVNFMDWTALSVPAGFTEDELPFGVTLIADTWREFDLFELARRWLSVAPRRLGATAVEYQEPLHASSDIFPNMIEVAVVGAHLAGFPLNIDLTSRGAILLECTATAARYRLYALANTSPPKPGLERVDQGSSIEVEVWKLPTSSMGSFVRTIKSPLGIGSIELCDGRWVHGFICEPWALHDAKDITKHGGWRSYLEKTSAAVLSTTPRSHISGIIPKKLKRVLIANRGEIAMRIIRTLHAMDMFTVSIYSSSDRTAPHVKGADLALPLVGDTLAETYLNVDQVLTLAQRNDCDAIIPGYGFLSENSDFAALVESAGLLWIGPTPAQMRDMGLKHRAREIAISAGVPVIPGSKDLVSDVEAAVTEARRIGYPVMLKSTAGGGGIGLQKCVDEAKLTEVFERVQRLGQNSFGNGDVLLERFVEHARHIEVQILGDGTGRVLYAGDRDCSLQRRHQKVIEEAPATVVPSNVQDMMRKAAMDLASSVKYRNVGTVEFIYDTVTSEFFFLEMNTRLQVEHPVTESVTGLDLVECMVKIATGDADDLFASHPDGVLSQSGASIEARIYAESPIQDFRPSHGRLLEVKFSPNCRVDTWISTGQEISALYDPMLAKLIAFGPDRATAIQKLSQALSETIITGVETNIAYLRQILDSTAFKMSKFTTTTLNQLTYGASVIEVLDSGFQSSIQDYPGRLGLWHIGIPPSGPMDNYSFRLANRILGNAEFVAGIECYLQGPTLKFHSDSEVAIVGANCKIAVDGEEMRQGRCLKIARGQTLSLGSTKNGARVYIAISGGIDVPVLMGSRSTFATGGLGGHNGRDLRRTDLLPFKPIGVANSDAREDRIAPVLPLPTSSSPIWTVAVLLGPHDGTTFFTENGLQQLFMDDWLVHHNSNRLGIRLKGPRPEWARTDGGAAGLHPSNIHDSPYQIGSVSFTGDAAVILTADGPSLGGFVVFATVVEAEMWKLGQMRPGDRLRLRPVSMDVAHSLRDRLEASITDLTSLKLLEKETNILFTGLSPNMAEIREFGRRITCRPAGERSLLLEFGEKDGFDMRQTFHIINFVRQHELKPIIGVQELTTGVRSVLVNTSNVASYPQVLESLRKHEISLGGQLRTRLPSRIIKLPLVFNDQQSQAAVTRYQSTIRPLAPYLPSNVEFLQNLNGLRNLEDIEHIMLSASFLVLGLGDVYKGSPCAVALDPSHRLFGTKYNPSRSFTPAGSVGIAGQYLCIYAMDSPGGYQLVGRTIPIWERNLEMDFDKGAEQRPWLFSLLDQIMFYRLSENELATAERSGDFASMVQINKTEFDLQVYEDWIASKSSEIKKVRTQREEAVKAFPLLNELLLPYQTDTFDKIDLESVDQRDVGEPVRAHLPGKVFKICVQVGTEVHKGQAVAFIEANKMEVEVGAPVSGRCVRVVVRKGQMIMTDEIVAFIERMGSSV